MKERSSGNTVAVIGAREKVLAAMGRTSIEGNNLHYRPDISWQDIERERKANNYGDS